MYFNLYSSINKEVNHEYALQIIREARHDD